MNLRDRMTRFVSALPPAQRVGIVAALAVVVMAAVPFVRWITTPSYTVLYSGLDDSAVATTIDELETLGVPYQLEAGGSRVLVPREQLYATRASLAAAGVAGKTAPSGYELLDEQGLSVSDFRQRVDYRRALEGELSRTLTAMDGIGEATVHLVTPEQELFAERQKPVTSSVLLTTTRSLAETEVEAVTFLVASAVEGLDIEQITVANSDGTVLHAPGDAGGTSVTTNRQLRQTREFESALAGDVALLLEQATGSPAGVVVRAHLNFDQTETESERFDPESQVVLREQLGDEAFEGRGAAPGGAVGVDGGPLEMDADENRYDRSEAVREFGVDRVTDRTIVAPGTVEALSVAIVMDDGTFTGAEIPPAAEVEQLVAAALGLNAERGDTVAVTRRPHRLPEEPEVAPEPSALMALVPQVAGALVLLVIAIVLVLMARRRHEAHPVPAKAPRPVPAALQGEPEPAALPQREPQAPPPNADLQRDVVELVQRQPEEIALLLRSWLADRRGVA